MKIEFLYKIVLFINWFFNFGCLREKYNMIYVIFLIVLFILGDDRRMKCVNVWKKSIYKNVISICNCVLYICENLLNI